MFPNKPHKHAASIKAWADGAEIEVSLPDGRWHPAASPMWNPATTYRIKPPPPKPDVVMYTALVSHNGYVDWTSGVWDTDNVKGVFDGETGKLKSVELIKE